MNLSSKRKEYQEPILTKGFSFIFLSMFCGSFILYMMITTVSEYATSFGATKTIAGLVSSIFLIGELVTRLMFGKLLRRIGWKKAIALSMTAQFLACCFYFAISNIYLLILIRFVHGLCFGLAASVVATTGIYLIPKSRYGEGNGLLMTSTSLSVCLGPMIGGILYDHYGSHGCFIAALFLAVVMGAGVVLAKAPYPDLATLQADPQYLAASRKVYDPDPLISSSKNIKPSFTDFINQFVEKDSIPAAVCIFFCGVAYSCVLSFIRLFGTETGLAEAVSAYFVVYAIVLIVSRPSVGKLQDRFGDNFVVYPCVTMQIISFLLLVLTPNSVTVLIAAALLALGYGTLNSVFITIACRNAPYERKSYATTTYWIGTDLGVGCGPVLLGAIAESGGYSNMFLSAAIISAVVLPVYFFLCHQKAQKHCPDQP